MDVPLTVKDFADSDWEQIIEACERQECSYYSTKFESKVREAKGSGDEKTTTLFGLLQHITSMVFEPDDHSTPFKPSAIIDGFSEADLAYLNEIVLTISKSELQARVADVLWLRKRDYKMAQLAVAAYLDAGTLLVGENWDYRVERIERASDLAAQLNDDKLAEAVIQYIESALTDSNVSDTNPPSFLPARLMELLQKRRFGDPSKYRVLVEKIASSAEAAGDWYKARVFWDIAVQWYAEANDDKTAHAARLRSAETFVREALAATERVRPSSMVVAHFLEYAIHALRKIGGEQERITELHGNLLDYQKAAVSETSVISHPFDASDLMTVAVNRAKGKELYDAILSLAMLGRPSRISNLEQQAVENREKFVLSHLFKPVIINEMGRNWPQ